MTRSCASTISGSFKTGISWMNGSARHTAGFPGWRTLTGRSRQPAWEKARLLLGESSGKDFDLDARIQELSAERARLLAEHGFPGDYLKMRYTCPLCHDTGYVNNQKCVCFKKAAVDLLYTQSNIRDILQTENFDHFSFDFYSDDIISPATGLSARQTARDAVRRARDFIKNFDTSFENLFLYGDTGVGKTFLSHCIAKELIDTAHCVI